MPANQNQQEYIFKNKAFTFKDKFILKLNVQSMYELLELILKSQA